MANSKLPKDIEDDNQLDKDDNRPLSNSVRRRRRKAKPKRFQDDVCTGEFFLSDIVCKEL